MLRNWWAGVAVGLAVALGAVVAVNGATGEAQAQSGFTVSAGQLQTNQRISQAAVRRSNRALNYLAPIRTAQTDAADDGRQGVRSLAQITGSGQGWATGQIAERAITGSKINEGAVEESKLSPELRDRLPVWAVVEANGTLRRGSPGVTSTRIDAGNYRLAVPRDLTECSYTGTQDVVTAAQIGFVGMQIDPADNQRLVVRTTDQAGVSADRPFNVQVTCGIVVRS